MGFGLLAQGVMVLHLAFLAYLVLGGFLAWRWRRTIRVHLAVVAWGVAVVTVGPECPLTHLENWARRRAGGTDLPGGFIDTYLTGVVYPPAYLVEVRLLVAAAVLTSWVGWWHRGPGRVRRDAAARSGAGRDGAARRGPVEKRQT